MLEPLVTPDAHVSPTTNETDIVDLYTAGHASLNKAQMRTGEAVPFIHQVKLEGPNGELVRIWALFDDGAMVPAMCSSIFDKVKHRLHNFQPSVKRLRMANGTIVASEAQWSGIIELDGVRTRGQFEVFNSGGGWAFLFGKPMLQAFRAIHDYNNDSIKIANDSRSATLMNQVAHPHAMQQVENGISLTMDIKQRAILVGGKNTPPSRQVTLSQCTPLRDTANENAEELGNPTHQIMGQWRHIPMNPWQQDKKRLKQIWRRVRLTSGGAEQVGSEREKDTQRNSIVGSDKLPPREVQSITTLNAELSINTPAPIATNPSIYVTLEEEANHQQDELIGEMPELPACED